MAASDPFTLLYPPERLHPNFQILRDGPWHQPARQMIRDIYSTFCDVDGNFVEQFQTTGFDSRIWELFVHAFLRSTGAVLDRPKSGPDFRVTLDGVEFFVEAVTANPSQHVAAGEQHAPDSGSPDDPAILRHEIEQVTPIRLGSALYSKLQKRYWELPQVGGHPIVLAIEDFHSSEALTITSVSLSNYLYNSRGTWYMDSQGTLHVEETDVGEHSHGTKTIPSGFFSLPEAENISAVLFGNSGTVAKFNRMGYLQGYGDHEHLHLYRVGTCANPDQNSPHPNLFRYEVGSPDSPPENWGQDLELFHNPRAIHPLPMELLQVAYHVHDGARTRTFLPAFHPYGSITPTAWTDRDE